MNEKDFIIQANPELVEAFVVAELRAWDLPGTANNRQFALNNLLQHAMCKALKIDHVEFIEAKYAGAAAQFIQEAGR